MIDTFGLLQKYTGISKYSNSEVITPQNIVKDMVDLLPPEIFNQVNMPVENYTLTVSRPTP